MSFREAFTRFRETSRNTVSVKRRRFVEDCIQRISCRIAKMSPLFTVKAVAMLILKVPFTRCHGPAPVVHDFFSRYLRRSIYGAVA